MPVQTVFDLPPEIQGLMPNQQMKKICGTDKSCVHIIVPESAADNMLNIDDGGWYAAISREGHIFFPADGTQPTTPEAVEYSCANIDNTENSPITDWYMKMFGVIDKNGGNSNNDDNYIKAGWDNSTGTPTAAKRIISFDINVNDKTVADPNASGAQISRKDLFIREFRKIASNPVGRVLLYRILIEIRRHIIGNIGVCEDNAKIEILQTEGSLSNLLRKAPNFFDQRDNVRNLKILWDQNAFSFTPIFPSTSGGVLQFNANNIQKQIVEGKLPYYGGVLVKQQRSIWTDDLFHELIHWYHCLRDPLRMSNDLNSKGLFKLYERIGSIYYPWTKITLDQQRKLTAVSWCECNHSIISVNFEEMRTILGADTSCPNYLEGDDISENLFALSRSYAAGVLSCEIRFGHMDFSYIEHIYSVEREIKTLGVISNYGIVGGCTLQNISRQLMPDAFNLKGGSITQYPEKIKKIADVTTA